MSGDDQHNSPDAAGNWQFKPNDGDASDGTQQGEASDVADTVAGTDADPTTMLDGPDVGVPAVDDVGVSWTASEFISHEKGATWYLQLALVTVIATAVVYLLTRDKISSGVIVLAAIVFGVYGARKPRTLEYRLNGAGLTIAGKPYGYGQFRSFWVAKEGAFSSITFMPLRRFMPSLTVYYSPQDEQQIMQALEQYLPMENRDRDLLDRFLHHIRF